jgi:hypothetical protein
MAKAKKVWQFFLTDIADPLGNRLAPRWVDIDFNTFTVGELKRGGFAVRVKHPSGAWHIVANEEAVKQAAA